MPRKPATASLADQAAAPGGAAAVDRALSLLQCFRAGDPPLSLASLAERTQLYKSTVLRLLASLEHAKLVERIDKTGYVLGRGVARLHHVYNVSYSLERIIQPALLELVTKTQESAAFHVLWGTGAQAQRMSLFRVDSPQPIRDHYKAGDMLPLSGGVGAKVLIAFCADSTLTNAYFSTPKAKKMLTQIRQDGYAAAIGDRDPEVAGIAAPIFKTNGQGHAVLEGALILTMPATRYNAAHIPAVLAQAKQLSSIV